MRIKYLKNIKDNFFDFFSKNRGKFFAVTALFFLGITIGAICDVQTGADDNFNYMNNFVSAYKLQGASANEIFLKAFLSYLRVFGLIWISGRIVYLIPLNLFSVAAKGFGLGFTISYFVHWNGFGGVLFGFIMLFIQNIIFIPALLIYSVYRLNFCLEYKKFKQNNAMFKHTRRLVLSDAKISMAIIFITLVCSSIEAYIISSLILLLCLNF